MQLLRTTIRGLGPFVDASVDLASLGDAQLVAVVGENGAGKTTALELALLGAPYRSLPTAGGGGSLVSFASMRGASVESDIALRDGRAVRFRQTVDPVTKGGEAAIIDLATGEPLIASTKVSEADAWVREHLPALDVVTASLFASQGSGGILEMKPADRKRLLLRVHGIERIETLTDRASKRALAAKRARETAQAQRDEAVRGLVEVSSEQLADAENAEADTRTELAIAEGVLAAARDQLVEARARVAALLAHDAELDRARREHAQARGRVQGLEVKLANNRALLADEGRIRAAHERVAALFDDVRGRENAMDVAMQRSREAQGAARRARSTVEDYERRCVAAERAHEVARARYDRHVAALAAVPARDLAQDEAQAARDAHEAALAARDALRDAQAGRSAKRITHLRRDLTDIAEGGGFLSPAQSAAASIANDDAQAAREASYPADLAAAEHAVREASARLARARLALDDARRAADGIDHDRVEEYGAACTALDELRGELRAVRDAAEARGDEEAEAAQEVTAAALACREAKALLASAEAELVAMPGRGDLRLLEQARARVEELEAQLVVARADQARESASEAHLDAHRPPPSDVDLALVDVENAEASVRRTQVALRQRVEELAALRARAEHARRTRDRVSELERDLLAADRELARWSRLAADLGRDGLQAHLVDAVGPELSALVNELLHACVSTRWTVTIATTRLTAKGEDREALELRVLDAESGREGGVETFSGGERVLLGEAISLALTVAACRTAGLDGVTLVRDESGAALDAENARRYVAMLRRAAGMVGASRTLLVSHSAAVVAECDAAIRVRDGAIEVVPVEEV